MKYLGNSTFAFVLENGLCYHIDGKSMSYSLLAAAFYGGSYFCYPTLAVNNYDHGYQRPLDR